MNNIFKYIASFVALLSGLAVCAQNISSGVYFEQNGIAYAKRAILNNDGTYTIDLETFVTGEVTQTYESVPVDVVLVLDVSGSMDETITTVTSFQPANVSSLSYSDYAGLFGTNSSYETEYYYLYNGDYRRVSVGRSYGGVLTGYYYYISFVANGRTYYINTSGQVVTNQPTNVSGYFAGDSNLLASNVQLYTQVTSPITKMDALQSAVGAFIDQIAHNDWYKDDTNDHRRTAALGNKISIVKFANNSYYGSNAGWNSNQAPIAEGNHFLSNGYNYTEVVKDFTPTSTNTDVNALKAAVNGLQPSGATAADYGMNLARRLIDRPEVSARNSNKTVVFFTDGAPTYESSYDSNVASRAITNSQSIKNITYGSGENATHPVVYSVGVFSGTVPGNVNTFMTSVATDASHYINASGGTAEDLKDIFTAIAHSTGGSGNTEVTGQATLTVDVVSSSFSVPKGFEQNPANAVTVLVAPCKSITTIDGHDYLVFGQEKAPEEYGLPAITPSISEADNKVSTSGFDYSENWCGPDASSPTGYHGYKQIIRFVITVNDDAVGGPAVETNNPNSGIYLPGATQPLISFNRPTVKLPVQIWIQKVGLMQGDNAVFTLARTPYVENFNPATAVWEDWGTKIVVGPDDYDPETGMYLKKQVGLNPDYYYRIKEDAWAFGYTYQLGGVQYTFGDNIQNPFVFTNTPNNKKFDEASVRNIFNERTGSK
jgi:von Willebrand factor type A domain.